MQKQSMEVGKGGPFRERRNGGLLLYVYGIPSFSHYIIGRA